MCSALFVAVCTASYERAESHSGLGLQPLIRDLLHERDQDIASGTSLNGPLGSVSIVDGWSRRPTLKRHRRQWSPSSVVQEEHGSVGDAHGATPHRKSLALQRADNLGADDLDEIELRDAASMEGHEPAEPEVGPNPGEVPSALATKGRGHNREVQEEEKQEEEKQDEEKQEEEKQEKEKQEEEQEAEPEPEPEAEPPVQGQNDGQETSDKTDEKPEEENPPKQTEERVDSEEEGRRKQRAKRRAEKQREEKKKERWRKRWTETVSMIKM